MNLRNKTLVVTLRTLLGLFILFSGVSGMMAGMSGMESIPAPMIPASQDLWSMGLFQLVKVTEIVAGLMLVTGFLPALALLFLAPLCVNILVFVSTVAPAYLPSGVIVTLFTIYLGYVYWDAYKQIFKRA